MPDHNPYAAPQASLTRVKPAALPLASATGRVWFPETSTVELTRLANWNVFIDSMGLLWGVFFCFAVLAFSVQWGNNPFPWIWGAALLLSGLRLRGGYTRAWIAWGYNLLLDAGFVLGMLGALVVLARIDLMALFLVGSVALVFLTIAGASVIAHFAAKPLYGSYPQRQLNNEVRYREQNRID